MLNIISGKLNRAQKVVIYGSEGIGKSTLAAQFPSPLFIDTEGGADHMDVRRISRPTGWDELIADVNEVAKTPGVCESLVLDTADWAERLAINEVCKKNKWQSLETPGYGRGYTYLSEEFGRLLSALDEVIAAGINVVITAHAKMRKFELPDEMGSYDRWEMKLSKQVAPLLKEWCDMLLFLNYKTFVVSTESNTKKA
nr:ATP-binding protein [Oscillospiraceae bacterium]